MYNCSFGVTSSLGFIEISKKLVGVVIPSPFNVAAFNNMDLLTSPESGPLPPVSPQISIFPSVVKVPSLVNFTAILNMLSDVTVNGIA